MFDLPEQRLRRLFQRDEHGIGRGTRILQQRYAGMAREPLHRRDRAESCQLWLPVTFDPKTGAARMEHVDRWNPWEPEKKP